MIGLYEWCGKKFFWSLLLLTRLADFVHTTARVLTFSIVEAEDVTALRVFLS